MGRLIVSIPINKHCFEIHCHIFATGTGLAAHLQVPLPYLLYRAQTRYEADLRGLQGIRGAFSPTITSPHAQIPANSTSGPTVTPTRTGPANVNGEYFPRFPNNDKPGLSRRDSLRTGNGNMSSSVSGRQLGIRTRLSSLGGQQSQVRSRRFNSTSSHATKKPCSSSILTLQGQKKTPRPGVRTLSPARGSPAGLASPNDASSEESSEEERDVQEEEERRQEEQNALDKKLKDLQRMMTKETLGLVSSPTPQRAFPVKVQTDVPRNRPLSVSSTSSSFRHRGLDLSRRNNTTPGQSHSPSQHSLSSTSSPHGSVPSIPSPPAENRTQPIAVGRMARHLSPQTNRTSPPAISTRNAMGYNARQNSIPTPSRTRLAGEIGSERGSEASSFSDLSMSGMCFVVPLVPVYI